LKLEKKEQRRCGAVRDKRALSQRQTSPGRRVSSLLACPPPSYPPIVARSVGNCACLIDFTRADPCPPPPPMGAAAPGPSRIGNSPLWPLFLCFSPRPPNRRAVVSRCFRVSLPPCSPLLARTRAPRLGTNGTRSPRVWAARRRFTSPGAIAPCALTVGSTLILASLGIFHCPRGYFAAMSLASPQSQRLIARSAPSHFRCVIDWLRAAP